MRWALGNLLQLLFKTLSFGKFNLLLRYYVFNDDSIFATWQNKDWWTSLHEKQSIVDELFVYRGTWGR
jgi:hypothetical protein